MGPILALRRCWVSLSRDIHTLGGESEETQLRQVPTQPPALDLLDRTKRKLSTGVFVSFSKWSRKFVFLLVKITRGDRKQPVGPWPVSLPQESVIQTPG